MHASALESIPTPAEPEGEASVGENGTISSLYCPITWRQEVRLPLKKAIHGACHLLNVIADKVLYPVIMSSPTSPAHQETCRRLICMDATGLKGGAGARTEEGKSETEEYAKGDRRRQDFGISMG